MKQVSDIQVERLNQSNAVRAGELIREYMVVTELERGNEGVRKEGLHPRLQYECDHALEVYGAPNIFYLARSSDQDLGGVGLKLFEAGKNAEVCRLYVRQAGRGRGVGSLLMDQCIAYAQGAGVEWLVLDVLPTRTSVIDWYVRLGFKTIEPNESLPMPMVYLGLDLGL